MRGWPTIENLEKCKAHELGDVIWPHCTVLSAPNLADMVEELRRRNLYLFDIWGYVPGTGPTGSWPQFKPSAETLKLFEAKLGPRWLGVDVGEQDGRYIGGYAPQMYPASASRVEQYFNFQRHFQRMTDDLGNKMAALVSLNFGHYFLKEGVYTLLGAETAQGLPNSQIYYAFIRGAGKQYGVLWFGNASIYNRWGFKTYEGKGVDQFNASYGPTEGTSLSLLKRLMYSHILYNSALVGFESGWFEGAKLSPIGRVQQAAGRWIKANGTPGTMLAPIAVMTDFFAGWTFARHLYTDHVYRVWGNLPYGPGDYLTDGVLDRLYPGYENSSYYHDESGFLTPTPFGDSTDCLLSDAPGWLLSRYSLLVVTGELAGGAEIRDKLVAYVQGGGRLVITAGNVVKMPGGLAGVRVTGPAMPVAAKQRVDAKPTSLVENAPFALLPLEIPAGSQVLMQCGKTPAAIEFAAGKGKITVLASPFGVGTERATKGKIANPTDGPLAKPFPLLKHVAALLDQAFRRQTRFEAGPDLQVIACRKDRGVYTVGVLNNAYHGLPFSIVSHCGPIESIREMPVDTSERGAPGQLPPGIAFATIGVNGPAIIAGGDVRIFEVRLKTELVEEIPHVVPAPRPRNRILPLRKIASVKEEILARPTFFEHFDGIVVDWRYLHDRRLESVQQEAGWIARQKLRVIVDLTSGINLFPDLRLVNNSPEDLAASLAVIDDVLAKTAVLGGRDLILSMHSQPEVDFTSQQHLASTDATLKEICRRAESRHITVYLRVCPGKPPATLADALGSLKRLGIANLRLAVGTGLLVASDPVAKELAAEARGKIGLWMAGQPALDIDGRLWSVHQRIADSEKRQQLAHVLAIAPDAPVVLDVFYENHDAEYLDASFLERSAAVGAP
jgi:hypothetical protein